MYAKIAGWENTATAPDSIIRVNGRYHLFYHAIGMSWQSGMAVSEDLVHWTRYKGNPLFPNPSPVIVDAGNRYLLYTHKEPTGVLLYISPK
jgi:sucrose-6-phosphate hydrolase SacC (GH32 family)